METWESAIVKVFESKKLQQASVQDIYSKIGKYRKLGSLELEYTEWNEPRYQHIVRATLNQLHKKGLIERIRRGVYVLL